MYAYGDVHTTLMHTTGTYIRRCTHSRVVHGEAHGSTHTHVHTQRIRMLNLLVIYAVSVVVASVAVASLVAVSVVVLSFFVSAVVTFCLIFRITFTPIRIIKTHIL